MLEKITQYNDTSDFFGMLYLNKEVIRGEITIPAGALLKQSKLRINNDQGVAMDMVIFMHDNGGLVGADGKPRQVPECVFTVPFIIANLHMFTNQYDHSEVHKVDIKD